MCGCLAAGAGQHDAGRLGAAQVGFAAAEHCRAAETTHWHCSQRPEEPPPFYSDAQMRWLAEREGARKAETAAVTVGSETAESSVAREMPMAETRIAM
jgi:hypothetical protein